MKYYRTYIVLSISTNRRSFALKPLFSCKLARFVVAGLNAEQLKEDRIFRVVIDQLAHSKRIILRDEHSS